MKTESFFYLVLLLLTVMFAGFSLISFEEVSISEGLESDLEFQKVVVGVKDLNYYPNTVTVKEGEPVRVYLDDSIGGCLRSFTIPELGLAKHLVTAEDYVEFVPDKKGTFTFMCSMGMGTGKIVVE